jgi:uncharacterized protein (TIGR03435 family)
LTGKYDFAIDFKFDLRGSGLPARPAGAGGTPGDNDADPGPDLAAAVQQQLGLRLVASKANLDVLIIDKIQKAPTDN